MAGVGLVTVSLRRSMKVSGMRKEVSSYFLLLALLLLLIFHEPAVADLPNEYLSILEILQCYDGRVPTFLPLAGIEELLQFFDAGRVVGNLRRCLLDQFIEISAVAILDPFVHEIGVRQVG